MQKNYPIGILFFALLWSAVLPKTQAQTWEVFDSNFNLEKKIASGNIFLLGNSLRINVWEDDLSFLDPEYNSFARIDSARLYQYMEPWIVIKNGKNYGAFHEYGEQVLESTYDEITTFYTHLLARKGTDYFVYDRGQRTTRAIGSFAEARIARNGQVIARHSDGSFALPLSQEPDRRFVSLTDPAPDVILAQEASGYGLINREGSYILEPIIDEMSHLEENHFFAKNDREYLLINALSTDADIRYNSFHQISIEKGVLVEYIHGKLRRIMKKDGILLDIVGMDSVRKIDDYYNVHFRDASTGLLNPEGKWEVRPTAAASQLLPGNEGLYGARMGGSYGYVDATGNTAIKAQYDRVLPFSEGLAAVQVGSKWGYIDAANELSVPYDFDAAGPFSQGVAIVREGEQRQLIGRNGEKLGEACDRISRTQDGYYLLEKNGLFGLAKPNGHLICSPQFDEIRREGPNQILVRKEGSYGIMQENGDFVLPLYYSRILFDEENQKILAKSEANETALEKETAGKKAKKKRKTTGA
ncbi:WG containing repeat-containing protein [Cyclobacterium xiamenense]|uniref:WG containing repeat-containing protein n=1 Tax=Cyclobacterium xiamenense TaxID=1297121 RepID=A0A1H6Y761_9BACT|nr:WG repeat-containing protein [Cyclobacterium xiamenense]SEJ37138.1 WG containing repeat-containing protein [Cyclobacterium xiamenense]